MFSDFFETAEKFNIRATLFFNFMLFRQMVASINALQLTGLLIWISMWTSVAISILALSQEMLAALVRLVLRFVLLFLKWQLVFGLSTPLV